MDFPPFQPATFDSDIGSLFEEWFSEPGSLFSKEDFGRVLQSRTADMLHEIQTYSANGLLNTGTERLLDYFYDKYCLINIPVLDEQNSSVVHSEVDFEVTSPESNETQILAGTRYKIALPFTGDPRVFNSNPSSSSEFERPIASIDTPALHFKYDQVRHDSDALSAAYEQDLSSIKDYLTLLANEADAYNSQIRSIASKQIKDRKKKLLNDQGVAASLGIRLERAALPATYAAPQVQRKPRMVRPKANNKSYVAEPTLEMVEYENILKIIRATSLVIERNPSTFAQADEPVIRDHFLVQLNGHYKGQATGETFNSYGKSDILIRVEDKSIFIAELKFWNGPQSITDALDQILHRYTTWRDSKIALIVLNRRRNFSAVLRQIPDAIEACENVRRSLNLSDETDFRYVLQHPNDPDKELILTVMCFEVPEKR